ncbi:amino acid permease [Streptomyces sp. SID13588]|uniref:amino acid permease n=1 Tax=Streptomyces sp. SID13588 TaxID=2706051 RepID=UPI0013C89690|nr:amino acid permease [Streptomyces sp. SID13588]NEA73243.1 amino acid permease [Streptomyces sp. SID13588]
MTTVQKDQQDQPDPPEGSDEERLAQLGYTQVLARRMSAFSNFAVSFTIISVLSGCLTLYMFGMNTGGPAVIMWGWVGVGLMTLVVGLAMAEVCSAYPTSAGLYYWARALAPERSAAAWAWFTGWFNVLGQVAVTAGIDFGAASFLNAYLTLQFDWPATPGHTMLLFAGILVLHGVLNTFGVRIVALLNDISVWWHVIGVVVIVGALAIVPDSHQSASFVFTEFVNNTGWNSSLYVVLIGLLMAQYTFTGYDASAHMTEETHDASVAGPRGIVRSIWTSWVAGFVLLLGFTFSIHSYSGALDSDTGVPPAQILIDGLGAAGGKALLLVVIVAQLFCGMASVTANSRMIYAFSRDGALPYSRVWHRINERTRTPTNAVWLAAFGAMLLGLPYLINPTAYAAVTSIAVIGLYIAYVIPTFLRLRKGDAFERGPWHLGRWSRPIGIFALGWVALITVLFMLPQVSPVTAKSFNYAPVAVLVVLGFAATWWLVSARHWFLKPATTGDTAGPGTGGGPGADTPTG